MKHLTIGFTFICAWFIAFALSPFAWAANSDRVVTFTNQCPFPVWIGISNGAYPQNFDCLKKPCPAGTTCKIIAKNGNQPTLGQCFWNNPTSSNYQLETDASQQLTFKDPQNLAYDSFWSGGFAARTNCVNGVCETADCGKDGHGGCAVGFQPPVTQAEMTFNRNGNDFYDVEMVNGANLPISIAPNNSSSEHSNNYFWCGSPGNPKPDTSSSQPACPWQMQPPYNGYHYYLLVSNGGSECSKNSDCASGETCGLSALNLAKNIQKTSCGRLLGYWNANQVCGTQNTFGAPFNCASPLPANSGYGAGATLTNLYQCVPPPGSQTLGSCFQKNADGKTCCGATTWSSIAKVQNLLNNPLPDLPPNSPWLQQVYPSILWLKIACPTAYTYPFDDPSSTFQCKVAAPNSSVNQTNYSVTFCPGGKTGNVK